MNRRIPIFYSALLLTGVNLLLRFAGTSFQVYLSGAIGSAGIGLLQLVMSVGALATVTGVAGIRTATMYLTAEACGKNKPQDITRILSGCLLYSIACSSAVSLILYFSAPQIAQNWIGDIRTETALRLYAFCLPSVCLCSVMTGYFTAANRIGTLAVVEVGEQLCSMAATMALLQLWAHNDAAKACHSVILGNASGTCMTLGILAILRIREHSPCGNKIPIARPLAETALPLATADILKSGINTVENLMVPKRLALNLKITNPLAAFGLISGMVFPILMFPACILFALAELLIPELAHCAAAGSKLRIRYLASKSLRITLLYGAAFCGLEYLLADALCLKLYGTPEAGRQLQRYALLIPMLYCDAITDAAIKGLGQQKICVRYNILTSALDVAGLYLLLPHWGLEGYFLSFFVTHLVNFILSLRRLIRITKISIPLHMPLCTAYAVAAGIWAGSRFEGITLKAFVYIAVFFSLLCLMNITNTQDLIWIKKLLKLQPEEKEIIYKEKPA